MSEDKKMSMLRSIPNARRLYKIGFSRVSRGENEKEISFFNAHMCKNVRRSSAARLPQRYAMMPNRGTAKITKPKTAICAITWLKKVTPVFPSPFKTLPSVVPR